MSTKSTSFNCAIHPKFPAKFYCTTCHKLLCLDCSIGHMTNKCNVDSCDLMGNIMMKELLKETENLSIIPDMSQIMKNSSAKMKDLFKWIEKEAVSKLCECQKKMCTDTLSNEIKQKMEQLKNEHNFTELYIMCINIKEQRNKEESKEKVNNNAEIIKEYQNKIQIIFNEFCKKFTEINCDLQSQVESVAMPEPGGKIESILELFDKITIILKIIEIKDEILKNKWYQKVINETENEINFGIFYKY